VRTARLSHSSPLWIQGYARTDLFTDSVTSLGHMKWSSSPVVLGILILTSCSSSLSVPEEESALVKGASITDASFQALSGKLQQAMERGGPAYAVEFCSLNALSILDSLSSAHGATIRRTSDRIRNPQDLPYDEEARILRTMLAEWKQVNNETAIRPRVELHGDSIAYYRPIFINTPACLKCHGIPGSTLDSAAQAEITARYEQDQATGYAINDLRGVWSVRWKR